MDDASRKFLAHTIIRCCLTMANCILPSTLANYSAGLIGFMRFCDDFNVPESDQMPASETLLSFLFPPMQQVLFAKVQ